jgi:hypothetical protein
MNSGEREGWVVFLVYVCVIALMIWVGYETR